MVINLVMDSNDGIKRMKEAKEIQRTRVFHPSISLSVNIIRYIYNYIIYY